MDPQSLPICTIEEAEGEDPEDENSNKYAIFEPEKIKEYKAKGQFTVVVVEPPQPHAGYELDEEKKYEMDRYGKVGSQKWRSGHLYCPFV